MAEFVLVRQKEKWYHSHITWIEVKGKGAGRRTGFSSFQAGECSLEERKLDGGNDMKTTKKLAAALLALVMLLSMAACGNNTDANPDGSEGGNADASGEKVINIAQPTSSRFTR